MDRRRTTGRALLVTSVVVAICLTAITALVLLLLDPAIPKAEALKTGGLAGGAVVALYALWLNDRRRRTEEARHELESDKVADERFVRSVELLGSDADQVRVGALHALARHAGAAPRYKQTVLDVLCAYLRRPFEGIAQPEHERQVRFTAQRLIADLLPWGQDPDTIAYHLDLTGAHLEHFRLEGRRIGRLIARQAQFHGITRLAGVHASKPVLFTEATFHGRVDMRGCRFDGGVSFQQTTFAREVDVEGAAIGTFADLQTEAPQPQIGALTIAEGTRVDGDTAQWALA
jgi:hypothetical protein